MLRRWASMVRGLRNSCAPTSREVAPVATSRAIVQLLRGELIGRLGGPAAWVLAGGA